MLYCYKSCTSLKTIPHRTRLGLYICWQALSLAQPSNSLNSILCEEFIQDTERKKKEGCFAGVIRLAETQQTSSWCFDVISPSYTELWQERPLKSFSTFVRINFRYSKRRALSVPEGLKEKTKLHTSEFTSNVYGFLMCWIYRLLTDADTDKPRVMC
jgi:hypothetical protein